MYFCIATFHFRRRLYKHSTFQFLLFHILHFIMNENYEDVFSKSQVQIILRIMSKSACYHVYEEKKQDEFVSWWEKIKWFRRNAKKSFKKKKFIENRTRRKIFEHIMLRISSSSTKFRKWFVQDVQSFCLIQSLK